MTNGFSEFLAEHRAEHRTAFNRWCVVVADSLLAVGAFSVVRGRWKAGVRLAMAGLAVAFAGHVRDGNLPKALEVTGRHPIWSVRGDLAIAKDMLLPTA